MEWLLNNWLWIAVVIAFFAMHMFGHGGHSRHSRDGGDDTRNPKPSNELTPAPGAEQSDANSAVPRAAGPTNPALSGMPAHSDYDAGPTTTDEKHHRHGY